jgi:hypothetical protein
MVHAGRRKLAASSTTRPIIANLQGLGLALVDKGLIYNDPLVDKSLIS